MKFAVVCLFVIISVVYAQEYTNKYDNVDVDQILHNDRLLRRYVDCVLDKPSVRCPAEALEIKKHVREALQTECAKCSDRQKEMATKIINYLVNNKREMWDELKAKYDPEDRYAKQYEDKAKEENV